MAAPFAGCRVVVDHRRHGLERALGLNCGLAGLGLAVCRARRPARRLWRRRRRELGRHPGRAELLRVPGRQRLEQARRRAARGEPNSATIDRVDRLGRVPPSRLLVVKGGDYGIPYNVVGHGTTKKNVKFQYAGQSDKGPYPIPKQPKIEGGSDRHLLIVDATTAGCTSCSRRARPRPAGRPARARSGT